MKTVKLIFKYTESEFVKAQRQYLIASKTIRRYDLILAVVFLLFSISYLFISSFSTLSMIIAGTVLIVTILGSVAYFLMPIFIYKQTAKYHDEYLLVFSKYIIYWKTSNIETHFKWDVYSELWESEDFYFLNQKPHMYTIIPKRVFENQDERQAFEDMALSNLKSDKRTF